MQGLGKTQVRQQVEARHSDTQYRAECIDPVEHSNPFPHTPHSLRDKARQEGQGGTHAGGWDEKQETQNQELKEAKDKRRWLRSPIETQIKRLDPVKQQGKNQGIEANSDLQQSISQERFSDPIRVTGHPEATQREASHEDSDDRFDGKVRIANHPAQHSRPQDLVESWPETSGQCSRPTRGALAWFLDVLENKKQ